MTAWDDMDHEMQLLPLDGETADRLMAGRVAWEDAPPGYAPVVRLLDAACLEAAPEEGDRERELVVAFALAVDSSLPPRRAAGPSMLSRARFVAATLAVTLGATAGLAATGSLPDPVQDIASSVLDELGISIPTPSDRAGARPDHGDNSASLAGSASAWGERSEVSRPAGRTPTTGVDKDADLPMAETGVDEDAGLPTAESEQDGTGPAGSAESGSGGPDELPPAPNDPSAAGVGNGASGPATDTEASGAPNGAVVSTQATNGKSPMGSQDPPPGGPGNGLPVGPAQATARGAQHHAAEDVQGRPPGTNSGGGPGAGVQGHRPGPPTANAPSDGPVTVGSPNPHPGESGNGPPGTNPGGGPGAGGQSGSASPSTHGGSPGPSTATAPSGGSVTVGSPSPTPSTSESGSPGTSSGGGPSAGGQGGSPGPSTHGGSPGPSTATAPSDGPVTVGSREPDPSKSGRRP